MCVSRTCSRSPTRFESIYMYVRRSGRSRTKVDDAVGCCTFLEDLCPLVPIMMKKKARGHLNFTNPGTVR